MSHYHRLQISDFLDSILLREEPVVVGAGVIGLLAVQAGDRAALAETISRSTSRGGPDVVFEAVGIDATVTSAITLLRKGEKVVLIGNVAPDVELPLQSVLSRELTLLGSAASNGEYPQALALIVDRRVDVDALVSAVVPLRDGATWMRRLRAREPSLLKVVLQP